MIKFLRHIIIFTVFISIVYSTDFSRYPYISLVDKDEIVIAFKTKSACSSKVVVEDLFGRIIDQGNMVYDTSHAFYFKLPPGIYKYKITIGDTLIIDEKFSFRIPSESDSVLSFLIFGDSGTGEQAQFEVRDAMLDFLNERKIDFIIHTGDVVYPDGAPWQYDKRYFDVYRDMLSNNFVFLTPGNHDYYYDGKGSGYFSSFFLPMNEYGTEEFYSFTFGNAFFISLNITGFVDYKPGSRQYNWLIKTLSSQEAQSKMWRVVFFHIPPFSTVQHYDPGIFDYLFPVFKSFGVNLILCGHVHGYERGYSDGITVITTGGGGAPLHYANRQEPKVVKYSFVHHFVWIKITGGTMIITAVDKKKQIIDSLSLKTNINVDSVVDKDFPQGIFAFPNPFNSDVHFVLSKVLEGNYLPAVNIYDLCGRFIKKAELLSTSPALVYYWDGKNYKNELVSSGIYIAVIETKRKKFVKQILRVK
jgi:Icc-related predicted phosphoesterase